MKMTQFALNPHIRNMARLFKLLNDRDEELWETGLYEIFPYNALTDNEKVAADILLSEGSILNSKDEDNLHVNRNYDGLDLYRKERFLLILGEKLHEQDIANNFVHCPDALLPF